MNGFRAFLDPERLHAPNVRDQLVIWAAYAMGIFAVLWGAIYFSVGETLAASIPWAYAILSALSLLAIKKYPNYTLLRQSQLAFSLLLPFFLMIALGGWVNSSAVVVWSLISPLSALIYFGTRRATYWFFAFLLLIVIGIFIDFPALSHTNAIPPLFIILFFAMNISGLSTVAFVFLRYFVKANERAYELLEKERLRSENLIENMLPPAIAERLKQDQKTIANKLDDISILFADISGFTRYSMNHSPEEVVTLLDSLFSTFDQYVEELGLEKIKTIGDAYMISSGLEQDAVTGAKAAAKFALKSMTYMHQVTHTRDVDLDLTVGLHTGTVVAGVIGVKKFSYDIWGDAVNIAARLQQNATRGHILLSGETLALLENEYVVTDEGSIPLKGHTPV
ncbi:MAG: adenylate/guanylate cyclase domain-containing protein, partial [Sneathiella sp.]